MVEIRRYGYYRCPKCSKLWESARTYCIKENLKPVSRQACKQCLVMTLPYRTEELEKPVLPRHVDTAKAHRSDLCERCKSGRLCTSYNPPTDIDSSYSNVYEDADFYAQSRDDDWNYQPSDDDQESARSDDDWNHASYYDYDDDSSYPPSDDDWNYPSSDYDRDDIEEYLGMMSLTD